VRFIYRLQLFFIIKPGVEAEPAYQPANYYKMTGKKLVPYRPVLRMTKDVTILRTERSKAHCKDRLDPTQGAE
jgi:hypothetical protein